jgi:preprotein translocase subunit SecA
MEEDMPLESKLVSRFIESAQTRVEGYNFDIRKNVVEYDDVIAKQREVIYADRRAVLEHGDMHERILSMIRNEVASIVNANIPGTMVTEEEQLESLFKILEVWVDIPEDVVPENIHAVRREAIKQQLVEVVVDYYERRGEDLKAQVSEQGAIGFDPIREFERSYLLQVVDRLWMDHIDALDVMRAGIGFRSIGQRDPLVEFKNEAFRMFDELKAAIQHYTVDALLRLLRSDVTVTLQRPEPVRKAPTNVQTNVDDLAKASGQSKVDEAEERRAKASANQQSKNGSNGSRNSGKSRPNTASTVSRVQTSGAAPAMAKVGRNDLCPCGSGKKYKKCHGA